MEIGHNTWYSYSAGPNTIWIESKYLHMFAFWSALEVLFPKDEFAVAYRGRR